MREVLTKILRDSTTYIFLVIYFGAILLQQSGIGKIGFEVLFTFILFFCVLPGIMFFMTRKTPRNQIWIRNKTKEASFVSIYFVSWLLLFMIFGEKILADQFLSNGVGFWGLLVIIPLIYLLSKGYRGQDVGITNNFLIQNMRVTFWACLIVCGLLLFLTPGGRFITSSGLPIPILAASFAIAVGYALVFAALFEEFFFRAVLQTRLTQYFNSEIKGILIASIFFGLYHLPFEFYKVGPAQGDFVQALSNVLTEQMFTAPIFGILWARTRNLIAPIFLHACIDAINLIPQIVEKYF